MKKDKVKKLSKTGGERVNAFRRSFAFLFFFLLSTILFLKTEQLRAQCMAFTVSGGGGLCSGAPGVTVNLSSSQAELTYQLKRGSTNVGAAISGTGSSLSWSGITTAGTYTVV